MHCIESRIVIGPSTILFLCALSSPEVLQAGGGGGGGSKRVKNQSERSHLRQVDLGEVDKAILIRNGLKGFELDRHIYIIKYVGSEAPSPVHVNADDSSVSVEIK